MERYQRHRDLIGKSGFEKIRNSKVMVAGAGGLGSTVLNQLVRIGVGTVHVFDYVSIDQPDLNRQILYNTEDIGKSKCNVAAKYLKKINPEIDIITHCEKIDQNTQIPEVDLVFDCLDNFTARYHLDALLLKSEIPMIHAGVSTYFGQVTTIFPGKSKSLKECFPLNPEEFDKQIDKRVFPQMVSVMASIQVNEGINYLCGNIDKLLIGKILSVDLHAYSFDVIELV